MKNTRSAQGFTMVELLVVLALATALAFLSIPVLQTTMRQAKLRGVAQQTTMLLRQARIDAIKTSSQAVVRIVPAAGDDPERVEAFSDRDGDGIRQDEEPILATLPLPTGVDFEAPDGALDKASVKGFTEDPENSSRPNLVLFQRDGSIDTIGAFRFADDFGNYLEVRVEPVATARVEILKWDADEEDWYASGDGEKAWKWK